MGIFFSTEIGDREREQVDAFIGSTAFATQGALMTDLDGTALDETDGRVYIPDPVKRGVRRLFDEGVPVVLNTLRFPLSVIRTIGSEWYDIASVPVPCVLLNGSIIGDVRKDPSGELVFEETAAFPLRDREIDSTLELVSRAVGAGLDRMLVFYYPRDWRQGELIWTPDPARIERLKEKYRSCTDAFTSGMDELRERIRASETCMIFALADIKGDDLMAYQHTEKAQYYTLEGVDKSSGAKLVAERLGFDLGSTVGAGDTALDTFLSTTGLAVHVRKRLPYLGLKDTVHIANQFEFGDLLNRLAGTEKASVSNH